MLGNGFGQWFPIWLMDDTLDFKAVSDRMDYISYIGLFSTVSSLVFLLPFLFSSLEIVTYNKLAKTEDPEFWKSIKMQCTNKMCLINLILGACVDGFSKYFLSIANSAMVDFGYSDVNTGAIILVCIIIGAIVGVY